MTRTRVFAIVHLIVQRRNNSKTRNCRSNDYADFVRGVIPNLQEVRHQRRLLNCCDYRVFNCYNGGGGLNNRFEEGNRNKSTR